MENSRCNCCDKSYGNFGWGKKQGGYDFHDNYKKDSCKCCCFCWEDKKDDCNCGKEKEKDFSKCCCCSHDNKWDKKFDCDFGCKEKGKDFYGYESADKNNYYGW